MACPDKNKDKKIITEIDRRKSVTKEPEFELYSWVGTLFDIQGLDINFDNILSITKDDEWQWTVLVKI